MSTQISVGSSYITVPNTSVQCARDLLQRFCRCPSANDLLNRIASSTKILLDMDHHNPASVTETNNGVKISIPKKNTSGEPDVTMFLFELFNAKNMKKFDDIYNRASLGDLNIENYATEIETLEVEANLGRKDYKVQCAKDWNLPNPNPSFRSVLNIEDAMTTPKAILWKADWMCHTDYYRKEWIDQYRDTYCKKHPADATSCKVKKTNLCDYLKLQKMSVEQQERVFGNRLCNGFFATAPNHVKPTLIPIIQHWCPDLEEI